jgi:NSS family neurotransmitter:Na+ symporter
MERDRWATKIGLILALAGNAVGLGNFLRFPVQAAGNGGGAFMIPYFISILLVGIPLMWIELSMGRFGGQYGHGTMPGIFQLLWRHPAAKYLGVIGLLLPITIFIYYVYVESWTLGFAVFSLLGKYKGATTQEAMGAFLQGYQGVVHNNYFGTIFWAYLFFILTATANYVVLRRGISGGIERLANIGMPILILMAIILVVRVLTLGAPDPARPDQSVMTGLGFIWNPQFKALGNPKVWLAAAGQIFFTLSVGFGAIQAYASYLKKDDDIALSGIATVSTNEFCEVICGGTIAIPIACAFFGVAATQAIAQGGAFNLGFQSMPLVFEHLPLGNVFGAMWFFLLFIAGITSSVALTLPAVTFMIDELGWTRKKAVNVICLFCFIASNFVVFFIAFGFLDELDFWAGTFGVVLLALIEVFVFFWIFGKDKAWAQITRGAEIRVPPFFKYVMKYVTPLFLVGILGTWALSIAISSYGAERLLNRLPANAFGGAISAVVRALGTESPLPVHAPEHRAYVWGARALMIAIFAGFFALVVIASKRGAFAGKGSSSEETA